MNVPHTSLLSEEPDSGLTIEFIGHATILLNLGGYRFLFDPHLCDRFGSGLFGYYPAREIDLERMPDIDAIIISHAHRDHFDVRSLSLLDKEVPVFSPSDYRLDYVLRTLGFKERYNIEDWSQIHFTDDIEFLWTPSLFKVPEHGMAIRYKSLSLWNTVDTVVSGQPELIERVLKFFNTSSLDVLMITCQVLLELSVCEAMPPLTVEEDVTEVQKVMQATSPRYLVPFADGHYSEGAATWLNHQKFAFGFEKATMMALDSNIHAEVFWPTPGSSLYIDSSSHRRQKDILPYVKRQKDRKQYKYFHPGGWIQPAMSTGKYQYRPGLLKELLSYPSMKKAFSLTKPAQNHFQAAISLERSYLYRWTLIGENAEVIDSVVYSITLEEDVVVMPEECQEQIEICTTVDSLMTALEGKLNFSSALLAGVLREYHHDVSREERNQFIDGSTTDLPTSVRLILMGGFSVNLILNQYPDKLSFKALDYEIDQALKGKKVEYINEPATYPVFLRKSKTPKFTDKTYMAQLWQEIQNELLISGEPSSASRILSTTHGDLAVGILGRTQWQKMETRDGILIPYNICEKASFLGTGVRFPREAYHCFLDNICKSSVQNWTIDLSLPFKVSIERWRWPLLLPFSYERLLKDLHKRDWRGKIHLSHPEDTFNKPEWWLGMPPLVSRDYSNEKYIRLPTEDPHFSLLGTLRLAESTHLDLSDVEYTRTPFKEFSDFLIDLDLAPCTTKDFGLLQILMSAAVRFSWLITPDRKKRFSFLFPEEEIPLSVRHRNRTLKIIDSLLKLPRK